MKIKSIILLLLLPFVVAFTQSREHISDKTNSIAATKGDSTLVPQDTLKKKERQNLISTEGKKNISLDSAEMDRPGPFEFSSKARRPSGKKNLHRRPIVMSR